MSKYVKKDLFAKFKEKVQSDATNSAVKVPSNRWPNPGVGEYRLRFLPDKNGNNLYKKYFYHMFQVGDRWQFVLCPKTFDFEAFCPCCAVTAKLYKTGNASDKNEAKRFKRKEKFVTNALIISDPRDEDKDDDSKQTGKVKLFEFGTKLEQSIRVELLNETDGVGSSGYSPEADGYNYILRVGETKPMADGQKFLDYSTSGFAKRPSPIADSEKEIDEIMESTEDLDVYVEGLKSNEDDVIEILKDEQVYDLIASEYEKIQKKRNRNNTSEEKVEIDDEELPWEEDSEPEIKKEVKPTDVKKPTESKNSTDEDLLNELMNM